MKDIHAVGKEIAQKGQKPAIYQQQILLNSLYVVSTEVFNTVAISRNISLEFKSFTDLFFKSLILARRFSD